MTQAESVFKQLAAIGPTTLESDDIETFAHRLLPAIGSAERRIDVAEMSLILRLHEMPTASALARALDELDREARRVVAARRRGVRPETLRGRGVHLVPRRQGLVVERAEPGSLEVLLGLGALYQAVVSDPVSFVLNVAALMDYGKSVLRLPGRRTEKSIVVRLPELLPPDAHEFYTDAESDVPSPMRGEVKIPSEYSKVTVRIKGSDGSSIKIDCER